MQNWLKWSPSPSLSILRCGFCDVLKTLSLSPLRHEQRRISACPRSREMQRVWTPTLQNKSHSVFEFVGVKKIISAHLHIVWQFACCKVSNWFHFNVLSTYWFSKISFVLFIAVLSLFLLGCEGRWGRHTLLCVRGQLEINFHICEQSLVFHNFCSFVKTRNIQLYFHSQWADFLWPQQFVRPSDFTVTLWQRYT